MFEGYLHPETETPEISEEALDAYFQKVAKILNVTTEELKAKVEELLAIPDPSPAQLRMSTLRRVRPARRSSATIQKREAGNDFDFDHCTRRVKLKNSADETSPSFENVVRILEDSLGILEKIEDWA